VHDAANRGDVEPAARAGEADLSGGLGPVGETNPRIRELLGETQQTARGILEAEETLSLVRERFGQTDDPEARAELGVEALDQVERQLKLTAEHGLHVSAVETELWASRNHLEQFLIQTRGIDWWRARGAQPRA
jgi:hypothetical protein